MDMLSPKPMPEPTKVEVIRMPPRRGLTDEQLDHLAGILDDFIHIPGLPLRIGLDPIIGLIPGLGDIISALMSFVIIFAAWQRGLPRVTIFRMISNVGTDTLLGTVPIFGDAFDAVWKSNRKNYNLLIRHRIQPSRVHAWKDWGFLLLLMLSVAAIVAVPIVFLSWLVHLLKM
jgi:Domain of unknown function (DUF4112)